MATLQLQVATPDGLALRTEAEMVTARSVNGEFGVLPGHLPLLAATRAGVLRYRNAGKEQVAAVGPGFVEALPERVLMLTDAYATPANIDRAAAERELAGAERALAEFRGPRESAEYEELARTLEWAQAQVEASRAG